jgi:hypothetical protein
MFVDATLVDAVDNMWASLMGLATSSEVQQVACLEFKEPGLNGGSASQPPKQACQSKDQLSFNG